jgi:hypothetical protein
VVCVPYGDFDVIVSVPLSRVFDACAWPSADIAATARSPGIRRLM